MSFVKVEKKIKQTYKSKGPAVYLPYIRLTENGDGSLSSSFVAAQEAEQHKIFNSIDFFFDERKKILRFSLGNGGDRKLKKNQFHLPVKISREILQNASFRVRIYHIQRPRVLYFTLKDLGNNLFEIDEANGWRPKVK